MQATTLIFPDYNSLWLFKAQTQAVNISITPKKSAINGPFGKQDIERAMKEFKATLITKAE